MRRLPRVVQNFLAFIVGFFGGGYLHWYAMTRFETTSLAGYSWNDPAQGAVLRSVLLADFGFGVLLTAAGGLLIIWRGFKVWNSLLFGFGASIIATQVMGVILCLLGC